MINVKEKNKTNDNWLFDVEIEDTQYEVIVDRKYWEKLTNREVKPSELVKKSFEFLLEREPKEAILKKFNLKQISTYFPEYEREIM